MKRACYADPVRALSLSLMAMLLACVVESPPPAAPPRAPAPAPEPAEIEAAPVAVAVAPVVARPAAIEAGYEHCCGNGRFRLEIGCGYLDLRCYQRTPAGWQRTYGRHCKEQLGMACYLNGCDNRCE